MSAMSNRLMQYAAIATAVPAAAAHAGIQAQTNLDIVVTPGNAEYIDFGAGWGEVFRFEVGTAVDRASSYAAWFQFDPDNTGSVYAASVMGKQFSSSGGLFVDEDPERLPFGHPISIEQPFAEMSSSLSTVHDLAWVGSVNSAARTSGLFSWYPDARGFIGFKMWKNGSMHFGWFDVESIGWGDGADPKRAVGPSLIIHGWGFQDQPRIPINAGDVPAPAAGGLLALAMGAAGVRRSRARA